jgi:hypothetical protein
MPNLIRPSSSLYDQLCEVTRRAFQPTESEKLQAQRFAEWLKDLQSEITARRNDQIVSVTRDVAREL